MKPRVGTTLGNDRDEDVNAEGVPSMNPGGDRPNGFLVVSRKSHKSSQHQVERIRRRGAETLTQSIRRAARSDR